MAQQRYSDQHLQPHDAYDERRTARGEWPVVEHPSRPDVRRQAIERMRRMSVLHARHVWERRYRDPIAPHALAMLFQQPRHDPSMLAPAAWHTAAMPTQPIERFDVTAAWRLWLEGPEVADLAALLFELHHQIAPKVIVPGYDLRDDLATARDLQMSRDAVYAGAAITSLDTPSGTWNQAREQARSELDIPSYVRIVLTDGTAIVCHRKARPGLNEFRVLSTHNLDHRLGSSAFSWTPTSMARLRPDPDDHRDPLKWLIDLNDTFVQADNRRIVGQHRSRP
jgi:hypothetical protein